MIELRTLGTLELTSAHERPLAAVLTQPRRAALLCYLALASPRGFRRRDSLLALFWPEQADEQARHALRQSLYFLRRALGPEAIVARGDDELAIASDHVRCDATEFDRAIDDGRLEDALAIYAGDLLPGFHLSDALEFDRWLETERSRLKRRAAEAAWALVEAREQSGDAVGAAHWAHRAVTLCSGDELALRRLLSLLERLGDRAGAVRAYDTFARDLEREYALEPSEQTREVLARIREQPDERGVAKPSLGQPITAERVATTTPAEPEPRPSEAGDDVITARGVSPSPRLAVRRITFSARVAVAALLALLGFGAWQVGARPRPSSISAPAERVIVADFENLTSDSTFGELVTDVLNSELAQSRVIRVLGSESVADVLRRMRQPETRLPPNVAREVAAREQIKMIVEGDVRSTGTGVILRATVIETASGDVIGGASENARDSTDVLAAIKRLSNKIRVAIGESRASIRETDRVWRLTTSSLPALRKHGAGSRAMWRGDYRMAAELFEEATSLDPEFAHAYLVLFSALNASDAPRGHALRAVMRAYELRERLTDRERYAAEGHYFLAVSGDIPRAIAAFRKHLEALRQLPPGEPGWYSSLGAALMTAGDFAEAERVLQEARQRHPTPVNQARLIAVLYAERKDAEAARVLDELMRRHPENPTVAMLRARLLADSGRYDDAHAVAAQARRADNSRGDFSVEVESDATRGRLTEALGHLREWRTNALARGELALPLEIAVAIGRLRLLTGDSAAAVLELDEMAAQHLMDALDPLSRPYLPVAMFYADAGRPRRAREWLSAYEREVPSEFRGPDRWLLHRARAAVYRAEGRLEQALTELQEGGRAPPLHVGRFDEPSILTSDRPELARLYEALGSADSAIAVYERYVEARSLNRTRMDAFELGTALERLGRLYEQRGDSAQATDRYARLSALWSGADAALRLRATSAARRAAAIMPMADR